MSEQETATTLGWQRLNEGRHGDAQTLFDRVLADDANNAAALHGAGLLAYLRGRHADGLALLKRAADADPARADVYLHLSAVYHDTGQIELAIGALERAIDLDPRCATYRAGLGVLRHLSGDSAGAIAAYRGAIELDGKDAHTLVNLAHLLIEADRPDEAEPIARRATEAMPRLALAYYKLGVALERVGRNDEAIAAMERALELDPKIGGDVHAGLGMTLLRSGQLKRGWAEYEWRFAAKNGRAGMPSLSSPRWDGGAMPRGTLLIQAEQGLGDTIHFARFAPLARERFGGRVVLRCERRLVDLIKTVEGEIEIASNDSPPSAHDVHVPLLSLPHVLGIETVAVQPAYLRADPAGGARWAERMREHPRPRVGLSWAGNPDHSADRQRSIDPRLLVPLGQIGGIAWFSLQRGARALPPFEVIDWSAQLDLNETAALMAHLDLVISVDTAIAHLAGALGRPVWTMLSFVSDWRWLTARDDTPWYASMRLFRQPARGDWNAVVTRIAEELRRLGPLP